MLLRLFLLFLLSLNVFATEKVGTYTAYKEDSLSTAAQKITIQQIASGTRDIHFQSVSVWCSVATTFTLSINGTAATATTLSPVTLSGSASATATGWSASDVGSGTTLIKHDFQAGAPPMTLNLSNIKIARNAGTSGNLTVSTTSITGTCRTSFIWDEER